MESKLGLALLIDSTLVLPFENIGPTLVTIINATLTRFPQGLDEELAERLGKSLAKCLAEPNSCRNTLERLAEELFEEVKEEKYEERNDEEWYKKVDEAIELMREATRAAVLSNFARGALNTLLIQLGIQPMGDNIEQKVAKKVRNLPAPQRDKIMSEVTKLITMMKENEKKAKELEKIIKEKGLEEIF